MPIRHTFLSTIFALIFLPAAASAQSAGAGLETLIQCKPGTRIQLQDVESQLHEIGLGNAVDSFYFPTKGKKVAFLGGELVAAGVFIADGESKIAFYLKNRTGKQLSKQFRVTTIDEAADTDEPSYARQTGAKTRLMIGSAADIDTGTKSFPADSYIICQVNS